MDFVNSDQNIGVSDFDVKGQVYFTLFIMYIQLNNLSVTYFASKTFCSKNTN